MANSEAKTEHKADNRHAAFAQRKRDAIKEVLRAAFKLTLFALAGALLLAITYALTKSRIEQNEIEAVQRNLETVLDQQRYDNHPYHDQTSVAADPLLGSDEPVTVYLATKNGKPAAAVFRSSAPNGYNGEIKLLIGIYADGTVAGVRVVAHKETPGLGDAIDERKSDWILHFTNRSLGQPRLERWAVKKDGGEFDQFTGATITPRAVVQAVKNTLLYYQQHADSLFQ